MTKLPDADDIRGLAKHLNADAVDLIEQVLQKHTAAILDVVRGQTLELKTEREKVRVLREALSHITEYWNRDQNETAMADALWHTIEAADDALAATAPEGAHQPWTDIKVDNPEFQAATPGDALAAKARQEEP